MRASLRPRLSGLLCAVALAPAASAVEPAAEPPVTPHAAPDAARPDGASPHAHGAAPAAEASSAAERRAAQLFQRAKASFAAGDDLTAVVLLKEARTLSADPRYVFNLGLVYHYSGDCAAALSAFAEYLTLEPHGEGQAEAQKALATLQPLCGPAQERLVRDEPAPSSLPPSLPPPAAALEPAGGGPPALAWVLLGSGAASAVASVATALVASRAKAQMESSFQAAAGQMVSWDECACRQEYQRQDERRERFTTLSWIFGLGSLSLAGAGTAVWLLDAGEEASVGVGSRGELLYRARF